MITIQHNRDEKRKCEQVDKAEIDGERVLGISETCAGEVITVNVHKRDLEEIR